MNYSMIIFENNEHFTHRKDPEKQQQYWAGWPEYMKALKEAGVLVGGAGLLGPETATTVRLSNGQHMVQDGPYADTKEQVGGFFILDVPDLDTALHWASRCPVGSGRIVEIRPNMQPGG
jgi:hypothetical protein